MFINQQDKARWARFIFGFACSLGLILSLCARSSQGAAPLAAQNDRTLIHVDVDLITTEVIVLDKKGNPVHDLKKEDFRLYEDGKQQEIGIFEEVNEELSPAPVASLPYGYGDFRRGKTILILFDDSTITPDHIQSTRNSAERFVKEHMRSQDVFAVASYDISLRILQSFTGDPDKILAAIRKPAVSGSGRASTMQQSQPFPSGNKNVQSTFDPMMKHQAESFLRVLDSLSQSMERLKGRKSILLFSEDISMSEESRSLYLNTVNSARKANAVFYTIDAGGLDWEPFGKLRESIKDAGKQDSLKTAYRNKAPAQSTFQRWTTALGVTSRGIQNPMRFAMFQEGKGTGSGSGSGSTGSTGTSSGTNPNYNPLYDTPDDPWATREDSDFGRNSMRIEQDMLRSFAEQTGGFSIHNTGNFDAELDKLNRQLSNYYILGFQSNNPKRDGSIRELEVKTDLKDVTLKYRKEYVDKRPLDTLARSKQEKSLLKAMGSPSIASRLRLTFRAAYFYDSPELARVLISSRIDLENAKFRKKGGQLSCDLDVMGVAFTENNSVAARFSESVPIRIDKENDRNSPRILNYNNYFKLRPGKYRIKLVASDGTNNLGSMEQAMDIPAFPENGMTASSLVVADRVSRLPALIQDIRTKLLDDSDPLVYGGMQITQNVENKLPVNSPLPVLYKLYNISGSTDRWKGVAKAKLLDDAGNEVSLPPFSLEQDPLQSDSNEATIGLTLKFQDLMPGKYKLIIETTELPSSQTATVQTDLELLKSGD